MVRGNLEKFAVSGLQKAYQILEELGLAGEEKIQKNQFGETALRADIEAEEVVIDVLNAAHIPIRIISEEHGIVDIGEEPAFLAILDGLDGSNVYATQRKQGRYGTMLAIFSNVDPVYDDYLFSGVMIHSPRQELFYSQKGRGCFLHLSGESRRIRCSNTKTLIENTKIYIDEYFEVNRDQFSRRLIGFDTKSAYSSAVHYTDVAVGSADAALECTRKQNLEIAVAFGLISEAGGAMVTLDGVSLGRKLYRTFGQDEHIPVVTASTAELASSIINHINAYA